MVGQWQHENPNICTRSNIEKNQVISTETLNRLRLASSRKSSFESKEAMNVILIELKFADRNQNGRCDETTHQGNDRSRRDAIPKFRVIYTT